LLFFRKSRAARLRVLKMLGRSISPAPCAAADLATNPNEVSFSPTARSARIFSTSNQPDQRERSVKETAGMECR